MATKKQRKRSQKERRHEYETVWLDAEGHELEEPPDDLAEPRAKPARQEGQQRKSRGSSKASATRSARAPLPPSWRRSLRRSLLLGAVIFVAFAFVFRSKTGQHQYSSAVVFAIVYTALFVPFTYYFDRFIYRRWERKAAEQPKKR